MPLSLIHIFLAATESLEQFCNEDLITETERWPQLPTVRAQYIHFYTQVARFIPVSYTHLDVYKRQVQPLLLGKQTGVNQLLGAVGLFHQDDLLFPVVQRIFLHA